MTTEAPQTGVRIFAASIGIDVGQKTDPSALCVAELQGLGGAEDNLVIYVRHMERLPLGTSFKDVAVRVGAVANGAYDRLLEGWYRESDRRALASSRKDYKRPPLPMIHLRIDATGLGLPVCELIDLYLPERVRACVDFRPCFFTHGDKLTRGTRKSLTVGKAYLVSRLKALAQAEKLRIASGILDSQAVMTELMDYEINVDERGDDRYGAFKVGSHDDLVTALGLACLQTPSTWRQMALAGPVPSPWGF